MKNLAFNEKEHHRRSPFLTIITVLLYTNFGKPLFVVTPRRPFVKRLFMAYFVSFVTCEPEVLVEGQTEISPTTVVVDGQTDRLSGTH